MQQLHGRLNNPSVAGSSKLSIKPLPAASRGSSLRANAYVQDSTSWNKLKLKHVVDAGQFNREALDVIFNEAMEMEKVRPGSAQSKVLDGYVMATLFYEPSTRTRLSFESAVAKLGGTILSTESAGEYSSAAKGETLEGARALCNKRG